MNRELPEARPSMRPALDAVTYDPAGLDGVLEWLHQHRACDLHAYRRASIARSVARRMARLGVSTYSEYTRCLGAHPAEFVQLMDAVLVNATAFFRDGPTWSVFARLLDKTLRTLPPDRRLRLWSAGCASGEEAYSLAILCAEVFGRAQCIARVRIYATDRDDDAVDRGRRASYRPAALRTIPPELREKYFRRRDDHVGALTFDSELRRLVVFGRHDLLVDPPLPRIDVLFCRNTMMFFKPEAQERLLRRLRFSVRPGSVLVVGKSELHLADESLFVPIDRQHRIFVPAGGRRAAM